MRILKTMIGTDAGTLVKSDTIEHEGGLWIVPRWLVSPHEGVRRPAYIIRIDTLGVRKTENPAFGDYFLKQGCIPIAVLEGRSPTGPSSEFEVVQAPDIQFPIVQ